jgi:hypothetical protein
MSLRYRNDIDERCTDRQTREADADGDACGVTDKLRIAAQRGGDVSIQMQTGHGALHVPTTCF